MDKIAELAEKHHISLAQVITLAVDSWSADPPKAQKQGTPSGTPSESRPQPQVPPAVWENIGMVFDRRTGEMVESEKLTRPPWTVRPVEGGATDYWPA